MTGNRSVKRIHLLGHPVSQSLSPLMHNAALGALGLDWEYSTLDTAPDDLVATLERLESDPDVVGCNVTVPHKIAVHDWLARNGRQVEWSSQHTGAVNTLSKRNDRWVGETTDFFGAYDALIQKVPELHASGQGQFDYDVAILGTGGSAQTLAFGFARHPSYPRSIAIFGRNREKAEDLAHQASRISPTVLTNAFALDEFEQWNRGRKSIVIQTTTVGMETGGSPGLSPVSSESIGGCEQVAFDLVYKPHATPFLLNAERNGAKIVYGIQMLIRQGALALDRWIRSTNDYRGPAISSEFIPSVMEGALREKGVF